MKNDEPKYPRIKYLRENAELTQSDVAKIIGVTQSAYSLYENGLRDIPTDTLIKLADFYRCSIDYLLSREFNKSQEINREL